MRYRRTNALSKLQDKLIDLPSSKLLDIAFGAATGGGGLFAQIFGCATGGLIRCPGSPTSDSIATRVPAGEYIVSAKQASKYLDLLNPVNSVKSLKVPNVGSQIVAPQSTVNTTHFSPVINVSGGDNQQNQDAANRIEETLYSTFKKCF
jgi:hypothetical protein